MKRKIVAIVICIAFMGTMGVANCRADGENYERNPVGDMRQAYGDGPQYPSGDTNKNLSQKESGEIFSVPISDVFKYMGLGVASLFTTVFDIATGGFIDLTNRVGISFLNVSAGKSIGSFIGNWTVGLPVTLGILLYKAITSGAEPSTPKEDTTQVKYVTEVKTYKSTTEVKESPTESQKPVVEEEEKETKITPPEPEKREEPKTETPGNSTVVEEPKKTPEEIEKEKRAQAQVEQEKQQQRQEQLRREKQERQHKAKLRREKQKNFLANDCKNFAIDPTFFRNKETLEQLKQHKMNIEAEIVKYKENIPSEHARIRTLPSYKKSVEATKVHNQKFITLIKERGEVFREIAKFEGYVRNDKINENASITQKYLNKQAYGYFEGILGMKDSLEEGKEEGLIFKTRPHQETKKIIVDIVRVGKRNDEVVMQTFIIEGEEVNLNRLKENYSVSLFLIGYEKCTYFGNFGKTNVSNSILLKGKRQFYSLTYTPKKWSQGLIVTSLATAQ